ncbi:hypothetical protein TNIN_406851 [Trichonephila inaurata madagascariensis]|uniref:Uncharacterized protein n=1 Tax=Trichonephila inaurata madagascariensis TaxID=2747483 RepID=A0A8X7C9D0_9ARAC|nr:hypothetical protein TNIN_406851 [Trichonephila inaurata madagascariensis]
MKEPVNPLHTLIGGMQWFLCVHSWIWRPPDATVMGNNVAKKRKISFICPQVVKDRRGILFNFRERPPHKCFSLRYLTVKVHGKTVICMNTD